MIAAILLMVRPWPTWDRIAREMRSLGVILSVHLLPLIIIVSTIEGFGLVKWGKMQKGGLQVKHFAVPEVLTFEIAQALLLVMMVFIGAKLIKTLGETFHGRHSFTQAFTVTAYGLSPYVLIHALDAFRYMNPWLSWIIGFVLTAGVLYHGIPRVMQPDPPHAFGLYLVSVLMLFLMTGILRLFTAWYLQGRFKDFHEIASCLTFRLAS